MIQWVRVCLLQKRGGPEFCSQESCKKLDMALSVSVTHVLWVVEAGGLLRFVDC